MSTNRWPVLLLTLPRFDPLETLHPTQPNVKKNQVRLSPFLKTIKEKHKKKPLDHPNKTFLMCRSSQETSSPAHPSPHLGGSRPRSFERSLIAVEAVAPTTEWMTRMWTAVEVGLGAGLVGCLFFFFFFGGGHQFSRS